VTNLKTELLKSKISETSGLRIILSPDVLSSVRMFR